MELFNRREFFECHDAFEEVWNELRGEEKICIQGLIQTAVGCYHASNGNFRGATSQFEKAIAKVSVHSIRMFGLEDSGFIDQLNALHAAAAEGLAQDDFIFPAALIPALQWIAT